MERADLNVKISIEIIHFNVHGITSFIFIFFKWRDTKYTFTFLISNLNHKMSTFVYRDGTTRLVTTTPTGILIFFLIII